MLVTTSNFDSFLKSITKEKKLGYDTETKTLWWWKSRHSPFEPGIFAAQFSTATEDFYLDFLHSDTKLSDVHWGLLQREIFDNPEILYYIHNAKFDLHQSANHGVDIKGKIHCTQAIARVLLNTEGDRKKGAFKLDTLAEKYLGQSKLVLENIPSTKIKRWGKNEDFEEFMHYDRAPLADLILYGERDTRLCYNLGEYQETNIKNIDETIYKSLTKRTFGNLSDVMENERSLTKVLFKMERQGVKLDMPYVERAYEFETNSYAEIAKELDSLAAAHVAEPINWNAPKQLKPLFDALGEKYSYTEKGNASFDVEALERSESPIAKKILDYRYHYKRAHTYFENFVWLADTNGYIHCNFQQSGTETGGRMSCWDPNLQNIPKRAEKQEKDFPVRKAFIPEPGTTFVDKDYKAAEYRLMFDYAKQMDVIEDIKKGLDPHVATHKLMPMLKDRDDAKTMNFRVLYGAGAVLIGYALGAKTEAEAKALGTKMRNLYYAKLTQVKKFVFNVRDAASSRGYIINWFGRMLHYDGDTSYKSPNGIIQSGVGDVAKVAMVRCDKILEGKQSKMLLQVHDALLFQVVESERTVINELQVAMETVYPYKFLPQETDAKYSKKSWGDLVDAWPAE